MGFFKNLNPGNALSALRYTPVPGILTNKITPKVVNTAKWLIFGGKSPLDDRPPSAYDSALSQYQRGQITTQDQARDALDRLVGWSAADRQQARAISYLRDQGALSRVVDLLYPDPSLVRTPNSPSGAAMFATGSFEEFKDPYTIYDMRLGMYMADNPDVASAYLRETDPMSLLPVLFEQDRNKFDADSGGGNVIRDIGGRVLGGLKAAVVNPWFSAERAEELIGLAVYNDVPDAHLRWQLASHVYELKANGLFGGNAERDAKLQLDNLMSAGVGGEEAVARMEEYFKTTGNLGMAGMLSDLAGKIIFDPLWLIPLEPLGAAVAKPIKLATGAERLSLITRLSTPAGREVAGQSGIRSLMQMPELAYAERKLASPPKGLTSYLFRKTPESVASGTQVRLGLAATVAMRQFDDTDTLARFLDDLNTTLRTGKETGLVQGRMTGVLADPSVAEHVAVMKNLDRDLIEEPVMNALKEGGGGGPLANLPYQEQVDFVQETLLHRIQTTTNKEIQRVWGDSAAGRLITNKLMPFNRGTQAVMSTTGLNTPAFAYLNLVSNYFHTMFNAFAHPFEGTKAFAHAFWTEGSSLFPEGGRYTQYMMKKLAPWGLTPRDAEIFFSRQSGAREIFDVGRMPMEVAAEQLGDDTLAHSQEAMDLIRRGAGQPAKHIGTNRRFRDAMLPMVYLASRIDTASRRAAMVFALKQQSHILTAPSRVSAERLLPAIERQLVDSGIEPGLASHIEGTVRDEVYGRLVGRRPVNGEFLTDLDIDQIVADTITKLGDTEDLSGFRSGISYAEDYLNDTRGLATGEAQVIQTNDLRDMAEFISSDILPRIGKDLTPDQAARMLRQKVLEYFDAADVARELGRMESTVRPTTTYSANLRLTDKALRNEMVDTTATIERFLRSQFFGSENWTRIPGSGLSPAKRYYEAARGATVENVEHLQGIRSLYDRFAGEQGLAEIAGDTIIPEAWLADLPGTLRAGTSRGAANIPFQTEEIASGVRNFKVGGVEISVSSTSAHPEIMIDIERVSGKGSVKELRDVEQAIVRIVEANPGRPVNAVVRRDLADILTKRGAKEISPGGADVGTVLDLTPLGRAAPSAQAAAPKFEETVYRGTGRAEQATAYTAVSEGGTGKPIFSNTDFYALDEGTAKKFGPNVSSQKIQLQNPLVITNDAQYRALTDEAGMEFPNLFGKPPEEQLAGYDKLKQLALDKGHDGIVIKMDPRGDEAKLLRNVFGDDQVAVFREATATPAQQAAEGVARRAVRVGDEISVMKTPTQVVDVQRLNAVDYELYQATTRGDTSGFVRIVDAETGNVVTIKKYPKFEDAAEAHRKAVVAYMEFLRAHFPEASDSQIRDFGKTVRSEIKGLAQGAEEGALRIPDLSGTRAPAAARPTAAVPAAAPQVAPTGTTLGDVWQNYFKARDDSWANFFNEAKGIAEGNQPALDALSKVQEHLTDTFKKHREILSQVTARAKELGSLDAAWREAALKVERLFARNARQRPALLNLQPNDLPRATDLLDAQGPLAQEVNDFVEWTIPKIQKDYAELAAGNLKIAQSPANLLREAGEQIKGRLSEVRQVGVANARVMTDFAMLNYNNQYGIDHLIKPFFPFSFWPSRQAAHWGVRAARNPGATGAVLMAMTQPQEYMAQYGYPSRLTTRIPIYMPWLSEFMGKMPVLGSRLESADFAPYYFIDPMRMLFPYKALITDSFDDPQKRNTPLGAIMDWSENYTTMSVNPFMKMVGSETGLIDRDAWRSYGFQGGPFGIPLTPAAREVGKWFYEGDPDAIPTAEQELYAERGIFSKGLLGRVLGLEPNKFDVYRAERALWTLATTGELLPGKTKEEQVQEAWQALDSHTGSAWKKAVKAAESENFLRQVTGYIGFPAGPVTGLNEGELVWLGLQAAYSEAARRGELSTFFEKYPEFELRSAVTKGISDPEEQRKAVDTELYYQSVDKLIDKPYAPAVTQLTDEIWRLRGLEQTQPIRDQLKLVETQLRQIEDEKDVMREMLDRAFPYRETEASLNRDPEERALSQLRSAYYEISWNRDEPYEAYQTRQQAFIAQLPSETDPIQQTEMWHEFSKQLTLIKIGFGQQINQAVKDGDYDRVRELQDTKEAQLENLHEQAQGFVSQQDFLRFMGNQSRRKTPEEREFDQASALFDEWMSLVASGAPFTSREKSAISAYFRGLPEIQKYYPLETLSLSAMTMEQRQAIMTRRTFWKTFNSIPDNQTKLDYLYMNKPEIDAANNLLGLPPITPIDVSSRVPEYSSDPLFGHVELMTALNQHNVIRNESGLTPDEQSRLSELLANYGKPDEVFGSLSADDADEYITSLYGEE